MELREIYSFICAIYFSWAFFASGHFFHRVYSTILGLPIFLWPASSYLAWTLLGLDLILCLALSPCWTIISTYCLSYRKDDRSADEAIIEWLPPSDKRSIVQINVDVVAVHGLGSHPINAWQSRAEDTEKEPVMWLRDFLLHEPELSPRVLSYSHDSRWHSKSVNKNLNDYGDDLLLALRSKRKTTAEQKRPIIFIGHSFGGLVIKQMLVNAHKNSRKQFNQFLLLSTRGLIFMGTPHKGARMTMVGKLWSLLGFWDGSSTAFLDFLGPYSEANHQLHEDFLATLPNTCGIDNTLCVFETLPSKLFGLPITEVVDRRSAIIDGCPNRIAMSKDHRSMQRLSALDDKTYQYILSFLQEWTYTDTETPVDESLLQRLGYSSMWNRYNRIERPHESTCQWIFEHEEYKSWTKGDEMVLWIKGHPGTGKSTLISYVERKLTECADPRHHFVLHFYFDGSSEGINRSFEGLLRALLYQLYVKVPSTRAAIQAAFSSRVDMDSHDQKVLSWQRQKLEDVLHQALKTIDCLTPVIMIDALDEAHPDELRSITAFLQRLITEFDKSTRTDDHGLRSPLAFCISCRWFPVVISIPGLEISMEEHNHLDVIKYLEHNLQPANLPRGHTLNATAWDAIVLELTAKATSSFQWAAIVVNLAFKYVPMGLSVSELRERLLRLPTELNNLYFHLLKEVIDPENKPRALHLLQWVCLGERSMSLRELRHAMVVEDTSLINPTRYCEDTDHFVESDDRMALQIVALSGGLLEVAYYPDREEDEKGRSDIVRPIHQSVLDFMLSDGLIYLVSLTQFPSSVSWLNLVIDHTKGDMAALERVQKKMDPDVIISACHHRMFMVCLFYQVLENGRWKKNLLPGESVPEYSIYLPPPDSELPKILQRAPLIHYAIGGMFPHAAKSRVFQNAVGCSWAEVVNMLRHVFDSWVALIYSVEDKPSSGLRYGADLLHVAARYNIPEILRGPRKLSSLEINVRDRVRSTPLHYAAKYGHSKAVQILLEDGALPNSANRIDRTPLIDAVGTDKCVFCLFGVQEPLGTTDGHIETIRLLVSWGADLEHADVTSGTALQEAARHGQERTVKVLLDAGALIDAVSGHEGTALIAAVYHRHEAIVKLLLDRGANPSIRAGAFSVATTALSAAAERNDETIFDMLIKSGARPTLEREFRYDVLHAARDGREAMFLKTITALEHSYQKSLFLNLAICTASSVFDGHLGLVRLILDIFKKRDLSLTHLDKALYLACCFGQAKLVEILLDEGADVNSQHTAHSLDNIPGADGIGGWDNGLQAAVACGKPSVVRVLLNRGVNVNIKGGEYGTSLVAAIKGSTWDPHKTEMLVNMLLDAGADVNAESDRYGTPLQVARSQGLEGVVAALLENGAE